MGRRHRCCLYPNFSWCAIYLLHAQKFENQFYAPPDLRNVRAPGSAVKVEEKKSSDFDLVTLAEQLQRNPQLSSALVTLLAVQQASK